MDKKELLSLLDGVLKRLGGTDITVLEITHGNAVIRVERGGPAAAAPAVVAHVPIAAPAAIVSAEPAASEGMIIKSPIVGTFYSAPSPDAPAFAAVGKKVKKGDTLCIIEAMKMMNELEAERDGVIARVLAQNGQLVEYGQPLFEMED